MSLLYLDYSIKWNLKDDFFAKNQYIIDTSFLFYGCSSLKELPDISKWDIPNPHLFIFKSV